MAKEEIRRVGTLPVNSRIAVDYSKTPPSIEFEYPDKDTSVIRRSSVVVLTSLFITVIIILILIGINIRYIIPLRYPSTGHLNTHINNITIIDFQRFNGTSYNETHYGFDKLLINFTWNNKPHLINLSLIEDGVLILTPSFIDKNNNYWKNNLLNISGGMLITIGLFLFNLFWIARVYRDTKWGNKKFPEFSKKLNDAHFSVDFSPENFPANNIIEIPLFLNMYLDYDATGDFAEQLLKVNIIEHPFNKLIKKGRGARKHIIKKKPQVYLWKCILEFKKKPEDGQIEIRWT